MPSTTFERVDEKSTYDFSLAGLSTRCHNRYVDGVQHLLIYGCDRSLAGRQHWYPQQVLGSPSGAGSHNAEFS